MIDPTGLAAFALVFLGATWAFSVFLGPGLLNDRFRGPVSGPLTERRAATLALVLPPVLALGLIVVLVFESYMELRSGTDHCLEHSHHLHLCLLHGGDFASRPVASALLILATWTFIFRIARRLADVVAAHGVARDVRAVGQRVSEDALCHVVPSSEPFAFAVGIFNPVVAVSSAAWDPLEQEQRHALLAHERAHVDRHDLLTRELLWIASLLSFPPVGRNALSLWTLASERLCDRYAVNASGKASVVAAAILAVARMRLRTRREAVTVPSMALGADSFVTERIESLLREEPDGARTAARLSSAGLLGFGLFLLCCACLSEPLHHLLETLLG